MANADFWNNFRVYRKRTQQMDKESRAQMRAAIRLGPLFPLFALTQNKSGLQQAIATAMSGNAEGKYK